MKVVLFLASFAVLASAAPMSVQVKSAFIKEKPSFVSKTLSTLSYGDKVEVIGANGDWKNVSKGSAKGWLHTSSLSEKEIVLANSKGTSSGASKSEVMMAGKGFNKEVENAYKGSNANLDYADVDKIEKTKPSAASVTSFAKDGKLAQ
jgi:hypothetical protein